MPSRLRHQERLYKLDVPLATGAVGYENEAVGVVPGTRTCNVASASTNIHTLGLAIEDFDQTAGDESVQIDLTQPLDLEYFDNDPGAGAIALATHFMTEAYFIDGNSVSATSTASAINRAFAGIVYDVDAVHGVGVKRIAPELGALIS